MTSSTASRQGAAAEGIFIGLLVRNTFIDDVFWDAAPPVASGRKRRNSAPPRVSSVLCPVFAQVKPDACHSEDESTQGGPDSTISDGQSSDAGLHDDTDSVNNEGGHESLPCEGAPSQAKPRWSDDDDLCGECCLHALPAPATTRVAEEHTRTSLKSSAKAWAPKPAVETAIQLESVVSTVQASLTLAGYGAALHVTKSSEGATITAYVGQGQKETFVSVAQNAIFMAAQAADQIYLLGYRAQPFTADAAGFFATFGEMGDPQTACWDVYQHGWCSHGYRCRWHHPTWMRRISVEVV